MRSNKSTFRIVVRVGKERFSTNTKEARNTFNIRKNFNMREPSISEKNNMIIFIIK